MVEQDLSAPRPGRPSAERKLAQWPRRVANVCMGHAAGWAFCSTLLLLFVSFALAAGSWPDRAFSRLPRSPLWLPALSGLALALLTLLCGLGFRRGSNLARLAYVAIASVGASSWAALVLASLARWAIAGPWPHRGSGAMRIGAECLMIGLVVLVTRMVLREAWLLTRALSSPLAHAVCARGEELRAVTRDTEDWLQQVWDARATPSGACLLTPVSARSVRLRAVLGLAAGPVAACLYLAGVVVLIGHAIEVTIAVGFEQAFAIPRRFLAQRRSIAAVAWDEAGLRLTPLLGRTVAIPWADVQQLQVYVPPAQTALVAAGGPAHLFIAKRYSPYLLPMTWQEECLQLLRALNARITVFDTNPTSGRQEIRGSSLVEQGWVESVEP
jgi:hypothetical protein